MSPMASSRRSRCSPSGASNGRRRWTFPSSPICPPRQAQARRRQRGYGNGSREPARQLHGSSAHGLGGRLRFAETIEARSRFDEISGAEILFKFCEGGVQKLPAIFILSVRCPFVGKRESGTKFQGESPDLPRFVQGAHQRPLSRLRIAP